MPTTPVLWKDPTQVNASDGGKIQAGGQIAPLANGGYVVIWTDVSNAHNPGGAAIVGQVYNALGQKVGGEVLLSKLQNGNQANAFQPAATTLSDGTIAIAFIDHADSGFGAIKVQIFDPTLTTLLRTDAIAASAGANPELAALTGGGYAVTYTLRLSATDWELFERIVSAGGVIGTPIEIGGAADSTADQQDASELATLSDGNVVAVFQDQSGTDTDIRLAIRSPTGTLSFNNSVEGAGGLEPETRPDVAALKGGGFVVVWTDAADIRATLFTNAGNVLAPGGDRKSDIPVNTTTSGNRNDATVIGLADGGFLVAWEDDTAGFARGQRFDAVGNKIGDEFRLDNTVTLNATEAPIRLALLADGRVAFVANVFDGADYDVVTSIWDPRDAPSAGTDGADTLTSLPGGATLSGLGGDDALFGVGGPDVLDGGLGNDTLLGGFGDDVLAGGDGADTLNGEDGNDFVNGGLGNDSLTGGPGADSFLFSTAIKPKGSNIDTIADFSAIDDTILLDNAIFTKLKTEGELKKKYFEVGKKANDGNDFIVYNKKTGDLSYDKNGDGKGGAILFVHLEGSPDDISKTDFFVV